MGVRQFLILFFSAMAVSLVILVIFFSLFFRNIDLTFDTRLPESAPDVLPLKPSPSGRFRADGVERATINVPPDTSHSHAPRLSGPPEPPPVGAGLNPDDPNATVYTEEPPPPEDVPEGDEAPESLEAPAPTVSFPVPKKPVTPPPPVRTAPAATAAPAAAKPSGPPPAAKSVPVAPAAPAAPVPLPSPPVPEGDAAE